MPWRPTPALRRAVLLTGVLALGGVLLSRPDVVLLAAPFAFGTIWALLRRPQQPPRLTVAVSEERQVEGDQSAGTISVGNPDPASYDLVVVRTRASRWLAYQGVDRPYAVTVPGGQVAELSLVGPVRRWGRQLLGPAQALGYAADGLLLTESRRAGPAMLTAYPAAARFQAGETMPRSAGLVGSHRSRQPGAGGELAGVRQFLPGDRLRRVDWRASLRTGHPHVAATLSDRDAEVVLVLDVLTEVGVSGGVDGQASVLDVTVRAAAAIAEHYLHQGDRVSLVEYGKAARRLRPASGRRQYLTVLEWLLDVTPGTGHSAPYERVFGPHLLSGDALVVVLTPLVATGAVEMLARLARSGRFVVAVDTLPPDLPVPDLGPQSALAYRMWQLERRNTVGALGEHGVPVVPWAGAGTLDPVLRRVGRLPGGPVGAGGRAAP
ncbi:DUF58 domain-containing protein [Natronosporangium hydrolyticum]|uniref:DUF58 domain-containing protein n=1 Tax=Natronosporangium hydrolyticum TaxID=2811111 RepID=A0A895YFB0_9ACTN|nr:DUF58 domain-containing protein [Natronosporangium hydrolyticum]QSB14129.1 DUF58 domain-containing protein [Natronosporangium hydrolyticum]